MTVVVVPPVWSGLFVAGVVTSWKSQAQPLVAAGIVIVPVLVAHAVPTLIENAAVPLLAVTEGVVQKVVATGAVTLIRRLVMETDVVACSVVNLPVEAVVEPIAPGAAKVAVPRVEALMVVLHPKPVLVV